MHESKLQKRLREFDARYRADRSRVERDAAEETDLFTRWPRTIIWIPLVLFLIALLFQFYGESRREANYRRDVRDVLKLLMQADRKVLDERLALQGQYQSRGNDPNWFVFPPQDNDDMQIQPPQVTGLSDKPLIAEYNRNVLELNRRQSETIRALRREQGAPPPEWSAVKQLLDEAQEKLDQLKQDFPARLNETNSALKALQQAIDAHRRALRARTTAAPGEGNTERDREVLYHWRLALLSRLVAKQRANQ